MALLEVKQEKAVSASYCPHIVFAGGGTGGQLSPGINIAKHILQKNPNVDITFVGTGRPMQRQMVRNEGFQYIAITAQPAPRGPIQAFRFLAENIAGYCSARWMLRDQKASLVVGLGGLASGATVRAANARGIPTVLLEPNAIPGQTARWLGKTVSVICAGHESLKEKLPPGSNTIVTGSPGRASVEELVERAAIRAAGEDQPTLRLVVLGGSFGAKALNKAAPPALARVKEQLQNWSIVHLSGAGNLEETRQRYADAHIDALVVGELDDAAEILLECDLVVSRAGATTLAELALLASPAIVIPSPDASDDHQDANARLWEEAGTCRVIDEETAGDRLDVELSSHLGQLLSDSKTRNTMANAMLQMAQPNAADDIARIVLDLCHGKSITSSDAA